MLFITITSVLLAILMSIVAWRAMREQRERSDARVEALAREIRQPSEDLELRPAMGRVEPVAAGEMFAIRAQVAGGGSRWGLALAVGAFAVASAAALAIVFSGEGSGTRVAAAAAPEHASRATVAVEIPLELIALSHERDHGQLTVQGVVRNPAAGTEMDRLSAVVVLFDPDGHVVTTGRAPVASQSLIPGGESPFAVTVADAANIARYRVSFRSDERLVAHVDKRATP